MSTVASRVPRSVFTMFRQHQEYSAPNREKEKKCNNPNLDLIYEKRVDFFYRARAGRTQNEMLAADKLHTTAHIKRARSSHRIFNH